MSSNNNSIFRKIWDFLTGGRFQKEDYVHPRESLSNSLDRLDSQIAETEEAFTHFLKNLRQSEAEHQDLIDAKDKWELEIKSISEIYKKSADEDAESRRTKRAYEALRHAVQQEIRTEKQVKSHAELIERQQEVKSQLSKNINKLRQHRSEFSNKLNELIARESLASTEKELYSSSENKEYLQELEDFEKEIRQSEYLAIGFKELNEDRFDLIEDSDVGLEEEMRLLKELK